MTNIMKYLRFGFTGLVFACAINPSFGQLYKVSESKVEFFSDAPVEDIQATNSHSTGAYNIESKSIAFSIPISKFEFEKPLMKDHFNEKYLETEKYPSAKFSGTVSEPVIKDGVEQVIATGTLTLHGVSKKIEIPGTIEKGTNQLNMKAKFKIVLEDYKIMRPQILWQNIAEEVEVTTTFLFKLKQ